MIKEHFYRPRTKYEERYCFHRRLSVHISGGGGVPHLADGGGGYPIPGSGRGYPIPGPDGGVPHPANRGVPYPKSRWRGTPSS